MTLGGGEGSGAGHNECVTAGFSLEMWKVGCTRLMVAGSWSRTAVELMILRIVNGPKKHGANFRDPPRTRMSLVESHTTDRLWSRDTSMVGQLLHPGRSFDEVAACDPPGAFTPPYECLVRGDSHLLLLAREQGGVDSPSSSQRVTFWMKRRWGLFMAYSAHVSGPKNLFKQEEHVFCPV